MNLTPAPLPSDAAPCVFLVDDDPHMLHAARNILSRQGYRTRCFSSPVELMTALDQGSDPPALVVSDIDMPEMTGIELFRRTRRSHAGLPFLFVTGSPSRLTALNLHGTPEPEVLRKPFSATDLARKVREALDAGS